MWCWIKRECKVRHTQDKWITTCSLNEHSLSKSESFNKFLEFDASEGFSKTVCHMQVHSPINDIPAVILIPNYTSPPSIMAIFLITHLIAVLQLSGYSIPSSTAEILLFNLVFHDGVTPISVSILKPPLRVIGVLPLKPQVSLILSVYI